jgi:hypothetical protein
MMPMTMIPMTMSPLAMVVIGAEIGTALALLLYASVLVSMHREAQRSAHLLPRLDDIGVSLQAAVKYGFRFGILAVVLCSLIFGGLT